MNSLCNSINIFPLKPKTNLLHFSHSLNCPNNFNNKLNKLNKLTLTLKPPPSTKNLTPLRCQRADNGATSAATSDIDMVRNKQGVYTPKQNSKVVILWDLDNKPPRGPPYDAAVALKHVAERFGDVVEISAYANRHAFVHLPQWVREERRERKQMDILERRGVLTPTDAYVCGVCGRKCKTNLELKKHFKQLHERERQKKLNRMRALKGKKRRRYKERFISGNYKYNEAARDLIKPKVGYGLAAELRRAGVYVKTVEDKPQAADWAVRRQMQHSMSRGIDWLILVSDDGDFKEMLRRAKEANLGTVVVGDWDRALGREADLWVPWNGVENGMVTEKDLVPKRRRRRSECEDEGFVSVTSFEGERDLDCVVDELVARRTEFGGARISAFSEEDEGEWVIEEVGEDEEYLLDDSEDEELGENDGIFWGA